MPPISFRALTWSSVRRRGSTYVVDAVGKTGNQVRLVIDGKAGQIKGLGTDDVEALSTDQARWEDPEPEPGEPARMPP